MRISCPQVLDAYIPISIHFGNYMAIYFDNVSVWWKIKET